MLFNEQQNQSEQYRHKKDVNFLRYGTSIVISEHSRLSNRMFISPLETDLLGTFFFKLSTTLGKRVAFKNNVKY